MHDIIIHATYMSSVNTRYSSHDSTKFTTLLTHIEYTKRLQDCDPTLHHSAESNLVLSIDKFKKWLREALFINKPFHEVPDLCLGLH